MKIYNQKGFTLVEVMIAAGLMAVVALGVGSVVKNQMMGIKAAQNAADFLDLKTDISRRLNSQNYCKSTINFAANPQIVPGFGGNITLSDYNGGALLSVGQDLGGQLVTQVFLDVDANPTQPGGNDFSATLTIEAQAKRVQLNISPLNLLIDTSYAQTSGVSKTTGSSSSLSGGTSSITQLQKGASGVASGVSAKPSQTPSTRATSYGRQTRNEVISLIFRRNASTGLFEDCFSPPDEQEAKQLCEGSLGGSYDAGQCHQHMQLATLFNNFGPRNRKKIDRNVRAKIVNNGDGTTSIYVNADGGGGTSGGDHFITTIDWNKMPDGSKLTSKVWCHDGGTIVTLDRNTPSGNAGGWNCDSGNGSHWRDMGAQFRYDHPNFNASTAPVDLTNGLPDPTF